MMIYESYNHHNNTLLKKRYMCYKFSPTCFISSMKASSMGHFTKLYNVFHKLVTMKSDPKKSPSQFHMVYINISYSFCQNIIDERNNN